MYPVNSLKKRVLEVHEDSFEALSLELFRFQAINNQVYQNYLNKIRVNPETIQHTSEIPFLPISFFKSHKVTLKNQDYETKFLSSGTTGTVRSTHYIYDSDWYKTISKKIFENFYFPLDQSIVLALLPSYLENPNSSLIHMINFFIKSSGNQRSGYIKTYGEIESVLNSCGPNQKVFLFGVGYALLDLAETEVNLKGVTLIETGGMKGRRKEITKEEFHEILKNKLSVGEVHSEYGMTELLSQAYSSGNGLFRTPDWMRVMTRETNDPFQDNTGKRTGVLKIIDLANIESCCFIETEDLGMVNNKGLFSVLGRLDNSDARGCNLMYEG